MSKKNAQHAGARRAAKVSRRAKRKRATAPEITYTLTLPSPTYPWNDDDCDYCRNPDEPGHYAEQRRHVDELLAAGLITPDEINDDGQSVLLHIDAINRIYGPL